MSRTVGYTASIGAQWLGSGEISRRGLLSPIRDLSYQHLISELARRGIIVQANIEDLDESTNDTF